MYRYSAIALYFCCKYCKIINISVKLTVNVIIKSYSWLTWDMNSLKGKVR